MLKLELEVSLLELTYMLKLKIILTIKYFTNRVNFFVLNYITYF